MGKNTGVVSLVLAGAMLTGCLTPVFADETQGGSDLEPVTLEWYVAEDSQSGNEEVFAALNEYLQEKINTTINFHFVSISEYASKVGTILMSGQDVDIVNCNSELPYTDYVKKDSFIPMDDLLEEYAPKTKELIPENLWSAMKVDGKIYGVPSYKDSVQMYSVMVNQTLADDLGIDLSDVTIHNYQDMVPIMEEAWTLRNEKHPEYKLSDTEYVPLTRTCPSLEQWAQYETINGLAVVNVPGVEDYEGKGAGELVFNKYDTQEFREMCETTAHFVTEGIIHSDTWYWDPDRIYSADPYAYLVDDIGSGYVTVSEHLFSDNFVTTMLPFDAKIASTNYLQAAVNCISSTSKNPERAMMALEIINTDPYFATTIRFGTEGKYWNATDEENVISFEGTLNEDPAARSNYYWYGAQFGSLVFSKVPSGYPNNFTELIQEANESAISDTNLGFIFDPTPVTNEIAACNAVIDEYETNLIFGFIPESEVDANIDEFLQKLNDSGAEKIVAEAQSQLDAWRAENK